MTYTINIYLHYLIKHSLISNFPSINMSRKKIKWLFCTREYFHQQHCNRHTRNQHLYSNDHGGNGQCVLCLNNHKNQKYCNQHMKVKHGNNTEAKRSMVTEKLFSLKAQQGKIEKEMQLSKKKLEKLRRKIGKNRKKKRQLLKRKHIGLRRKLDRGTQTKSWLLKRKQIDNCSKCHKSIKKMGGKKMHEVHCVYT